MRNRWYLIEATTNGFTSNSTNKTAEKPISENNYNDDDDNNTKTYVVAQSQQSY